MAVYTVKYNNIDDYLFYQCVEETTNGLVDFFTKLPFDVTMDQLTILKELDQKDIDNIEHQCTTCDKTVLYKELEMSDDYNFKCKQCKINDENEDYIYEKYSVGGTAFGFKNLDELKEIERKLNIGTFPDPFCEQGIVTYETYYDDFSCYGDGTNYIISYISLNDIKKHFSLS